MEKLVPQKLARHIGISNFSPKQVDEVLEIATIKPKIHQIELHPYLHQADFLSSLFKKNITAIAYAPLGNTNDMYSYLWTGRTERKLLTNAILNDIGRARGCTAAQVSLAWNMARNVVVIPKAASVAHQVENYATLEKCKLQSEDLQKINAVNVPQRFVMWPCKGMGYTCFTGLEVTKAAQGW
jgi:alcohol dehydrogenase (NADP+)